MSLRELVRNNFGWKAASFVLATLIWLTINDVIHHSLPAPSVSSTLRTFSKHPITVMTAAADPRGCAVIPSETTVTLSGPADRLESLAAGEIQVFVDLTALPGAQEVVRQIQVYPPPGVRVLDVSPSSVRVVRPERKP